MPYLTVHAVTFLVTPSSTIVEILMAWLQVVVFQMYIVTIGFQLTMDPSEYVYFVCNRANTVMVIIELTKCAVPVGLRCGSCKLKFCRSSTMFSDI